MIQGCIDSGAAGAKEGANVTEGGDEAESKVCVCWDYLLAQGFVGEIELIKCVLMQESDVLLAKEYVGPSGDGRTTEVAQVSCTYGNM